MESAVAAGGSMHVVMFPFLAFGHISPFVQLARKLAAGDGMRFTLLSAAANVPRVEAMLGSAVGAVAVAPLHLPHVPGIPEGAESTAEVSADGAELLKIALDGTRPQVTALLAELRPDAVLYDFATQWVADLAKPLRVKALYFSVFSAVSMAYLVVPARCPSAGADDLTSAPAGFPPYQAADLTYAYTSFHRMPTVYDRMVTGMQASDAIVLKTCVQMEGPYINYLSAQYGGKPVLVTGPVVPEPPQGELEEERLAKWLSSFPEKAVVFASFGSETFLPTAAVTELLFGLESSKRPFLTVLNFPWGTDTAAELRKCTPPGFEERVKGRGLVHTGWVQQQHILRHPSVGCFVNHAGLSSIVEGLIAGCRLVLLPMKNDQYLNSGLFARELRVGVEVARRVQDGWFGQEALTDAVGTAMADGWEGEGGTWREFLMDHAVQKRLAHDFVTDFRNLVVA